ncbi:MAG: hypothetical protein OEY03_17690, partial [Rhizobacter sp.]|nr:hypothetical protein [Rhizobacter sp.]
MRDIEIESLFAGALAPGAARRINGAYGPWRLPRGPGGAADLRIAIDGRWASVDGRSPAGGRRPAIEALSAEAGWPGGVKRAEAGLPRGPRSVALRADIPLLLDTAAGREWTVPALSAAVTGMRQAISAATPPATPPLMSAPSHAAAAGAAPDPELLTFACQAGGWNSEVRGDGTVHLDLPLRGAHRTIVLEAREREIRASMQLGEATLSRADATCLNAAGA